MPYTVTELIKKQEKVNRLLDNLRILEASSIVKDILTSAGLQNYVASVAKDEETFRYLLHYLIEGVPDEGREKMVSAISERLRTLTDLAVRAVKGKDSSDYYYAVLRYSAYKNEKLSDLLKEYSQVASELSLADMAGESTREMRKHKEDIQERIFNTALTSLGDEKGFEVLKNYLKSGYADEQTMLLMLSATTLSLLMFYDKIKFTFLLDMFESSTEAAVSAKALVGILLTLSFHPGRISKDASLKARLELWKDSLDYYNKLRHTVRIIVGTRDTERIASKIKDEVIPELMKLRPEIIEKLNKMQVSDLDPEDMKNNPEWEELLEKKGIGKKMQELSELQSEGADLMMVTFSNLKQFPFFNTASNWFLTFDIDNTALDIPEEMKGAIELFVSSGNMICDSDLYSLALAASRMPEMQRKMVLSQLQMQQDQMNEEIKTSVAKSSNPSFEMEVQKTVRDLYRFFKLFRKKEGFKDPFAKTFDFAKLPVVGEMMEDAEVMELIGEFYFKRGFYQDALPILWYLTEEDGKSPTLWEKIGFCYQSEGNFLNALEAYEKAALLGTPSLWLTKKLAFVNRITDNLEEALSYYELVLEAEPDNYSAIMNIGNILTTFDRFDEAMQHYYHALYLRPQSLKVIRAVAWGELLRGNFDKSREYFEKALMTEPNYSDYLNLGHLHLLTGNRKEAINYYRLSNEQDHQAFMNGYIADTVQLEKKGLPRTDALLILEATLNK